MSEELEKRFARTREEGLATVRRRAKSVASFLLMAAAIIVCSEVLLPLIRRPGADTREAYETVAEVLSGGRSIDEAPESARAAVFEHGEWSESDVARLVRLHELIVEETGRMKEASDVTGVVHSRPEDAKFWSLAALRFLVADLLREWKGEEARDLLRKEARLAP